MTKARELSQLGQSIDVNDSSNNITFDGSSNIGIKNTAPQSLLEIGNGTNHTLGGTTGDSLETLRLTYDTANTDRLVFSTQRTSAGTTWAGAAHRIQRLVDVTNMGYMQFGHHNSDLITFGEGSTEYVRIDGDGNVGINTTSPDDKLHVYSASSLDHIKVDGPAAINRNVEFSTAGTTRWNIYANSTAETGSDAGSNLSIARYADDGSYLSGAVLIERSTGNVGIGTATPSATLNVSGESDFDGQVNILGTANDLHIGDSNPTGMSSQYFKGNGIRFNTIENTSGFPPPQSADKAGISFPIPQTTITQTLVDGSLVTTYEQNFDNAVNTYAHFDQWELYHHLKIKTAKITLDDDVIIFEGSSANNFETTLQVTNPTQDNTITLPDATGTVALEENVASTGKAIAMAIVFG